MIEQERGQLYLGVTAVDGKEGPPLLLEASDLKTHGVIVGMTAVYYLDPTAPWGPKVGANVAGTKRRVTEVALVWLPKTSGR